MVGARGADRPATDQLQCLQDRKNSIAEALKNDSLVAAISSIRGMTLKSARSEEERRANYHNGGSRPGGIAGINARLYKEDLGGLDFDKIINLLSLKVWVYPDSVKIEGLIPLEIPMDNIQPDIPKLSGPTGGSQNSQSPLTDRRRTRPPHGWNVAPDRRPAPTFVAVLDSVPTGNSRSNQPSPPGIAYRLSCSGFCRWGRPRMSHSKVAYRYRASQGPCWFGWVQTRFDSPAPVAANE